MNPVPENPRETAQISLTSLTINQVYIVAEPIIIQADNPEDNGEVKHTRSVELNTGFEITRLELTPDQILYNRHAFKIKSPSGQAEEISVYRKRLPESLIIEE